MLDHAQVAHARREVENLLSTLERTRDITSEQLPKRHSRQAVIYQPVVAAVERTQAADEARVIEKDDDQRERNQQKWKDQGARPRPYQKQKEGGPSRECQRRPEQLAHPDCRAWDQPHGKRRLLVDRKAENPSAAVLACPHSARH